MRKMTFRLLALAALLGALRLRCRRSGACRRPPPPPPAAAGRCPGRRDDLRQPDPAAGCTCRRPAPARSSTCWSSASAHRGTFRSSKRRPTSITCSSARSQPSQGIWVPYDEKAEQTMREDFKRLWATSFLDDLRIRTATTPSPTAHRQDRDLPHGGARAGQDRQLRRLQADRPDEDRRAAARARHRDAPRLVRGRRRDPAHQDGAARDDGGEGVHQRRPSSTRSRRWPAARSW